METRYEVVEIDVKNPEESLRYDPDNHGDEMVTVVHEESEFAIKEAKDQWHYMNIKDKENKIVEVREVTKTQDHKDGVYIHEHNTIWASRYVDMAKKHGSVEWRGEKLALTQPPCLSGTRERPYYTAMAEDVTGENYHIIWSILQEWWDGDRKDESEACNWDKPIDVRKF